MRLAKQINRLRLGAQQIHRHLPGHRPAIYYVVPEANWSIDWDGHYITSGVREQFGQPAQLTSDPRWLAGQLLHYGSLWSYVGNRGAAHNARNALVATVFHGDRDAGDPRIQQGLEALLADEPQLRMLVVSNAIMEARFLNWGWPANKLAMIPLGVDLSVFKPRGMAERQALRAELGIAEDAFCIGSFQKDGDGWEEGLSPKLIKGPDIFVAAIAKLKEHGKLHVLLSGPARGYVKAELEEIGVPYTHRLLDDYNDVAALYGALDAYLITSREEGGPKGVLESLASGVPLVSSKVGLAPDVVRDGQEGLLAEVEDVDGLTDQMSRLMENADLRKGLSRNGLERIQAYDWMQIAASYYHKVYQPVMAG